MTMAAELESQILDGAVRVLATRRWPEVTLAAIAAEAGLSVAAVYRHYRSREAVLCALQRRVDLEMLGSEDESGSARDRLFDLLMRRFDALAPLKPAFALGRSGLRRGRLEALPAALLGGLGLRRGMLTALDAARLSGTCITTEMRAKILGIAYLSAFRVWLDDESADLAATMAALDKALERAVGWLRLDGAEASPAAAADAAQDAPAI